MAYCLLTLCLYLLALIEIHIAPPVDNDEREEKSLYETKMMKKAQEKEYMRYASRVFNALSKAQLFSEHFENSVRKEVLSGKFIDENYDLIAPEIKDELNEVKLIEIKYQQSLLLDNKKYMTDKKQTGWNPIHHENQNTFEKEDLQLLLSKYYEIVEDLNEKRHRKFKRYELEKERKRRKAMEMMTDEDRDIEMQKYEDSRVKEHEKIHHPGRKAQLEEVWEKQDGMDVESFDEKTFFNVHDKNSDGYLDKYEFETIFLTDLDKVYNESNPYVDARERDEEMAEMWESARKDQDENNDGLISLDEFIKITKDENFDLDEEWTPLTEKEQFTPEEYEKYERS